MREPPRPRPRPRRRRRHAGTTTPASVAADSDVSSTIVIARRITVLVAWHRLISISLLLDSFPSSYPNPTKRNPNRPRQFERRDLRASATCLAAMLHVEGFLSSRTLRRRRRRRRHRE